MPYLYITEWSSGAVDGQKYPIQAPKTPPVKSQKRIEITNESQLSEEFAKGTTFISVVMDAPCSLAWGKNPEAKKEFDKVHAGDRWFGVTPGDKLAVIGNED